MFARSMRISKSNLKSSESVSLSLSLSLVRSLSTAPGCKLAVFNHSAFASCRKSIDAVCSLVHFTFELFFRSSLYNFSHFIYRSSPSECMISCRTAVSYAESTYFSVYCRFTFTEFHRFRRFSRASLHRFISPSASLQRSN